MYLGIDLSTQNEIRLSLFSFEKRFDYSSPGRNREVLMTIVQFLEEQHVPIEKIAGMAVVVGSGSFTNTRIGCVLANTLAYILGIPVIGIEQTVFDNTKSLLKRMEQAPIGIYLSATYSAEPNIRLSQNSR